jgi:hypothetical protein
MATKSEIHGGYGGQPAAFAERLHQVLSRRIRLICPRRPRTSRAVREHYSS